MAIWLATCTRNSTSSGVQASSVIRMSPSVPIMRSRAIKGTEQMDLNPSATKSPKNRIGITVDIGVAGHYGLSGGEHLCRGHARRVERPFSASRSCGIVECRAYTSRPPVSLHSVSSA